MYATHCVLMGIFFRDGQSIPAGRYKPGGQGRESARMSARTDMVHMRIRLNGGRHIASHTRLVKQLRRFDRRRDDGASQL